MKAFVISLVLLVVISAGAAVILDQVQISAGEGFSSPTSVRLQ